MEDQRFQSFVKDPRCRDIPKNVRKVKIDKRFKNMLKQKQFKGNNRIDERGRIVNFSNSEKLEKLYNLKDSSEDNDSSSDNSEEEGKKTSALKTKTIKKSKKVNSVDALEDKEKIYIKDQKYKHLQNDRTEIPKPISVLTENGDDDTDSSEEDECVDSKAQSNNLGNNAVIVQTNKEKFMHKNNKSEKSECLQDEKLSGASAEDTSDSDDSDSTSDIFADPDDFDHNWEEWHEQAPDTDQIFKRLAVCNMDWDRIRADDLFTVFNSFKSADGTINSVKIYPSEFGLKRMEAERLNGPPELVEETLDPEAEERLDKRWAKFHREKLREYQLKRLQYYYAVVDCDSPETADHLYVELNGKEFESSSVRFDLRFIPDDTTLDHDPVSEAYKVPNPSEYRPKYFVSTALGQAKVDLTWDETDPQRQEVMERAFKEPDNIEKDIKDYLASSSGESEVEEQVDDHPENKNLKFNERISKYKELLQSLEEKEKEEEEKYDMEISWQPDLKEKTENLVKQKLVEPQNPFDEMIKKKKEERKLKKQQKSAINKDKEESDSESDEEYSDASTDEKQAKKGNKLDELFLISDSKKFLNQTQEKSSKKKRKNKLQNTKPETTQDFKFVEDDRFAAIYTSPEFNLDPSDPHFKKTDGNLAIIQEKQRRLKTKESPINVNRKSKKAKYW